MAEKDEKIEGAKTEKQTDEKVEWDKTKQEIDQYRASVEKLSEQKGELQAQVDDLQAVIEQEREQTAEKLAQIEAQIVKKAEAEKVDDIDNLDPDYIDAKVIKVLKDLKAQAKKLEVQISDKDKDIANLQKAKEQYEADQANARVEARRAELKEAMLSELDKEFGAKFRNDAITLANKKVRDTGKAPEGDFFIYKFIRDCYNEVAANAPKDKEAPSKLKTVSVDSGASGVTFKEGEIKEGSIDEVFPQIAAKYKGKGLSLPTT